MVMDTVKPVAVAVVLPNVGVNAAFSEYVKIFAVAAAYPVRVVVIIIVEPVPGAKPVTVAKPELPEPVTTTVPEDDAVPAHV